MVQTILSDLTDPTECRNGIQAAIAGARLEDISPALASEPGAFEAAWPQTEPAIPSPGEAVLREFDALHHKCERRVFRQCYRMLGNEEDAEDLTQEVFLQVYRKAHTFRGEASFSTWLHRMTINTVLMHLRRQRRWRGAMVSVDAPPPQGTEEGIGSYTPAVTTLAAPAESPLDKISVEVAVAQLSSGYQEIFVLHDLQGYRHEEIAALLGISEGTSKSQLHKARLRLRQLIGSAKAKRGKHRGAPAVRNARAVSHQI
jgi:RNA polymerase sigma-70 factor (ECF subfamily)